MLLIKKTKYRKRRLQSFQKRYGLYAAVSLSGTISFVTLFILYFTLFGNFFGTAGRILFLIIECSLIITNYIFYALAMHHLLSFKALVDGKGDIPLIPALLFYGVLFSVSPVTIIFHLLSMRNSIRQYDRENTGGSPSSAP